MDEPGPTAKTSKGNPAWRKGGPSPNPSGKRADGYVNPYSGMGLAGWDKRESTYFQPDEVTIDDAVRLWRGNDLAARIVETVPREMLRQGWEICVQESDVELAGGEYDSKDVSEAVGKRLEELGATEHLRKALCYRSALGGGAILLGVDDGAEDLRQPLDLTRPNIKLEWIQSLEAGEIIPFEWYASPRNPKYGEPAIYQINPTMQGTAYRDPADPLAQQNPTAFIHESRLLVFRGTSVSKRVRSPNAGGWGDSVFVRVGAVLRDFGTSWAAAGAIINEFAGAVYAIEGLADIMTRDNGALFAARVRAMNLMRSTFRAMVIDKKDSWTREQTPVTGLPELLIQFMYRLAAAADMPITLLFGMSPAGMNATGDSDIRLFYDRVKAAQVAELKPALQKLVGLVMRGMGGEPANWSIKFHPLWQPTDKEAAETRYVQAQTDQIYIDKQVVSPEEIARSRFGGDGYSYETSIDFKAREMLELPVAKPVERAGEDPSAKPEPPTGGGSPFGKNPADLTPVPDPSGSGVVPDPAPTVDALARARNEAIVASWLARQAA